jgi:predicted dehydrogenase
LAAGKHVISGKPPAMTSEEDCQLRDAAVDSGVAHVVVCSIRSTQHGH